MTGTAVTMEGTMSRSDGTPRSVSLPWDATEIARG